MAETPSDDLRSVIESSYERSESESGSDAQEKHVPERETTQGSEEVIEPQSGKGEKTEETPEKDVSVVKPEKEEQVRAETVPKKEEKPASETVRTRAPGTWTVTAREKWNTLPSEVQNEVLKREKDIANGFHEVGRIRQFGQDMQSVWAPYQSIIAAEGGDALGMTRNLFATAAALYHGTPVQKAGTIAQMIKTFGIDVATLDSMLAGEQPVVGTNGSGNVAPAQVQAIIRQEMAPFYQNQQAQLQAQEKMLADEVDAFARDPKNEFFDDVKDIMADYMDLAAAQNKPLDLQTAYNRAILAHDDIAKVVQERATRQKAATASAAAVAAKRKAVSVTGAPARDTAGSSEGSTLHDDIVNAIASLES